MLGGRRKFVKKEELSSFVRSRLEEVAIEEEGGVSYAPA